MTLVTTLTILGWTSLLPLESFPSHNTTLTYAVSDTFCSDLTARFWEDRLLSFQTIDCDYLTRSVRTAFDAWHHNVPEIVFIEAARDDAQVLLSAKEGDHLDTNTIAIAQGVWRPLSSTQTSMRIKLDESRCWFTDSSFCHEIVIRETFVYVAAGTVWSIATVCIVIILCIPYNRVDAIFRIVAWSSFFATPLLLWGAIIPCLRCYDFVTTVVHEIGHLLGLGHADGASQMCGCGAAATECADSLRGESPVMWSSLLKRGRACPTQNDVDGVRTLYGGSCDSQLWCYDSTSYAGFARIAVALVYSFALSWTMVCMRTFACRARQRAKRRSIARTTTEPHGVQLTRTPQEVRVNVPSRNAVASQRVPSSSNRVRRPPPRNVHVRR